MTFFGGIDCIFTTNCNLDAAQNEFFYSDIIRNSSAGRTCHWLFRSDFNTRSLCLSLTPTTGPASSSTSASGLPLGPTIGISVGVVLLCVAIGSVVLICRRKEANLCFKMTTPQPLPHIGTHIGTINTMNPVALAVDSRSEGVAHWR
jgi:hypothetical protein